MKISVRSTLSPSPSMSIDLEFDANLLKLLESSAGVSVQLYDWQMVGEIGGPSLPGKTLWVALPPMMRAASMSSKVAKTESLSKSAVHLTPHQPRDLDLPIIPVTTRDPNLTPYRPLLRTKPEYIRPDQALYAKALAAPRPPARLVETRWVGGIPVALIEIAPVALKKNGCLYLASKLQLTIALERVTDNPLVKEQDAVTDLLNNTQAARLVELVRSYVVNPADVVLAPVSGGGSGGGESPGTTDCLILTDNNKWDPTFATRGDAISGDLVAAFNRLATWKNSSGMKTTVVTISDILNGRFADFGTVPSALMTRSGNYVTVIDAGGRNCDVLHTNASAIGPWEKFTLIPAGQNQFALRTVDGHYVTVINGGGLNREAIHTDATTLGTWEKLQFINQGNGQVAIQTADGKHFLTAVGGGNRSTDVIHTDATAVGPWEKFKLIDLGSGQVALQTMGGQFLTAVGGGGRNGDTLHTNASMLGPWQQLALVPLGGDLYAFKTGNGNYITAVDGGGRTRDVIHTDAKAIGAWEKFTMIPQGSGKLAFKTSSGNYLTAVNGGGRNADSIHTDATVIGPDELFYFVRGPYALMTDNGRYVTAVDGGGKITDVIHTDAAGLGQDEKFALVCMDKNQFALRTRKGFYLTALDGGGRTPEVIRTDKTSVGASEVFTLITLGGDKCALRTASGNFITAVGGGARRSDVIHTDASVIGAWETFTRVAQGNNKFALRTSDGHYVTTVGGGGRTDGAIHTDQTGIGEHEVLTFVDQGGDKIALKTANSNYVTAVGGGGRNSDVFRTDSTVIGAWEKFIFVLQPNGRYGIKCNNGQHVQVVDGGSRTTGVARTDICCIGARESFTLAPVEINDLPSILRKFIRWTYDNWGISYLLLGGDVPVVPIRVAQVEGPWGISAMPTDFYYSSFYKGNTGIRIPYEWSDTRLVDYHADVSVGRAAVSTGDEAGIFVDKVIAYEQLQAPNGTPFSPDWPRRILFAASSWGRNREGWDKQVDIFPASKNPPEDSQYYHSPGTTNVLVRLPTVLSAGHNLLIQITDSDLSLIPYRLDAAPTRRGWFFALDADVTTNPSPSPSPTQWVVVYSTAKELDSARWMTFDPVTLEGSTNDEETLRKLVSVEIPGWDLVTRLYCDNTDLTPADQAAAPLQHISIDGLRTALNQGQHVVSLSGHGDYYGVLWEPDDPALAVDRYYLNQNLADSVTSNYMCAIVFADSCQTNRFIESSISKKLMSNPRGGAVAYIGFMNNGVPGVGKEYQKKFFHGLATCTTLGLAHDVRLSTIYGAGLSDVETRYNILMLNMLGDPSMRIHK